MKKKRERELTQSEGTSGKNGTGGRRNGRMMHWGKNEVRGRREEERGKEGVGRHWNRNVLLDER